MNMKKDRLNICILTFPIPKSGITPLSNLVDILYPLSDDIYLITGNEGYTFFKGDKRIHTYGIEHKTGRNVFTRITNYIHTQLKISHKLTKLSKNISLCCFFLGGEEALLLPILTAKLLRKKVVLVRAASSVHILKIANDDLFKPVEILSKINCTLSNRITLCSKNLIKDWNLEKYRNKISIASEHFIDFDKFKIKKKIDERDNLVGYIGRLSEEKGTLNFVHAIPKVLEKEDGIKFLIGGEGQLRNKIEKCISKENLNDKVKLAGWIPHEEVPDYLNALKLVVLPSYTEGLPNVMLEAMACGTPVLAMPVGAIPDIITDGNTGFIMENNSPACIAKDVMRARGHPDPERIVENARALVEQEFTYEAAVERYRKILEGM